MKITKALLAVTNIALALGALFPGMHSLASPPGFSFQPTNRWILPAGSDLAISMTATGSPPLFFLWKLNGVNLNTQTNDTLSLTNLQPSDAGTYMLVVTNLEGTNKSALVRVAITETNPVALPLALTGWNRDVVLENRASAIAQPFDGPLGSYALFEEEWNGHGDGLPSSRQFVSAINSPNVLFELQPYDGSNVLWLASQPTTNQLSGTLTLVQPNAYVSLSIVAASAFGASSPSQAGASGSLVLNFSDGSQSQPISFFSLDWAVLLPASVSGLTPVSGLGEVWTTGCCYGGAANGYGQALYQTDVNLLALGYSEKSLTSLTFTGSTSAFGGTNQTTSIFAVSGVPSGLGLTPPQMLASNVTNQNILKGRDFILTVLANGNPQPSYQWRISPNASASPTDVAGATDFSLVLTNPVHQASYSVRVANSVGVLTVGPAELNLYFDASANGYFNWGWLFFRPRSFRTQQSSNLLDWTTSSTYLNSAGFTRSETLQSPQTFFRLAPYP